MSTTVSASQRIDLSLQRITSLLQRLSNPQAKFPIIHVAGTNSKGSTIAYLSNILNKAIGISAASFTSPHLLIERDCCKVGDNVIEEQVWAEACRRVQLADGGDSDTTSLATTSTSASSESIPLQSTPFEILTARCFTAFDLLPASQRPEVLLVEVGMGGALDATNVFAPSQVLASVICPIDYDHQSFLGTSLGEIATQKAGIIKQGGLCILADQRRNDAGEEADDEVVCSKVTARTIMHGEEAHINGKTAVSEVEDTIRQRCTALQARLVKCFVPWQCLEDGHDEDVDHLQRPWSTHVRSHVRYAPILAASKAQQGAYVSSIGDPVVPGPALRSPRTRAALTGSHLALQALWSIARDETPCGLGQSGSDSNEHLRLRIAYGLQDERGAQQRIAESIQQTRIPGRAEWIAISMVPTNKDREDVEMMQGEEGDTHPNLHALLDGAHNPAAASALCTYIRDCIGQRTMRARQDGECKAFDVTVTWILAFSQGKDIEQIIGKLFHHTQEEVDRLAARLAQSALHLDIKHKVACVAFSTPIEGMPWVASVPAENVAEIISRTALAIVSEVQPFEDLRDALQWASIEGDGKSILDGKGNLVVIAGSLYLVSDVHRLVSTSS